MVTELFLSLTLIAEGKIKQGFYQLENIQKTLINHQRKTWYAQSEYILGKAYSQMAVGPKPGFTIMAKNIGFLTRQIPSAAKKAEEHFTNAIQISEQIGAKGFLGMIYLDTGLYYKSKRNIEMARKYILKVIDIFKERGADKHLNQAYEVLESL